MITLDPVQSSVRHTNRRHTTKTVNKKDGRAKGPPCSCFKKINKVRNTHI